ARAGAEREAVGGRGDLRAAPPDAVAADRGPTSAVHVVLAARNAAERVRDAAVRRVADDPERLLVDAGRRPAAEREPAPREQRAVGQAPDDEVRAVARHLLERRRA